MPISVTCPSCQRAGSVPDSAVGQRIKCPKCKNRFEVEAPTPGASAFDDLEPVNPALPQASPPPKRNSSRTSSAKKATRAGRSPVVLGLAAAGIVGVLAVLAVSASRYLAAPDDGVLRERQGAVADGPTPAPAPTQAGSEALPQGRVVADGPTLAPAPAPAQAGPKALPKDGWTTSRVAVLTPAGSPATVCLGSAQDQDDHHARGLPDCRRSLLGREIVRQALLIAARDGLGLSTRDATIGDPDSPAGGRAVAEVASSLLVDRSVVTFRVGEAPPEALGDFEEESNKELDHLGLVDRVEPLSRGRFVELLKQAGIAGSPRPPRAETPEDKAIEADLGTLSVFAQLAAIRATHEEIRRGGESPQLLGALVRGYGLLAVLTERFWHPMHEAYMARSLLYARRLESLDPRSPAGPWHKAFAEALAGYPKAALADLAEGDRRASAMKDPTGPVPARPGWARLVDAFCRYRADELVVPGIDRWAAMASLLRFVAIENSSAVALILETGRSTLEKNPECTRINDVVCDRGGVSVNHWATELGLKVFPEAIPARLRAIRGLPAAATAAIGRSDEPALIRALMSDVPPGEGPGEPSWAPLGLMVRETRYLQVWRRLDFFRRMLAVSTVEFLGQARPLISEHPYRNYLETFAFDPARQRREVAELLKTVNVRDPEDTMNSLLREMLEGDIVRMNVLTNEKMAHYDFTSREIARRASERERMYGYFALNPERGKLDPDSPIAIAASLVEDWKQAEPHMREWETSQAQQPDVLAALAKKYHELKKDDDSARCLKAYLKLSPDRWAFEMLADQYLARGDKVAWKATYDEALSKPDANLDHMDYSVKVANQLMREGRWEEARPYAEDAAESGAARGIHCVILCDEGRKDWAGAETWLRRLVERYPAQNWSAWLLWCARTGRGNIRQADQAAVRAIRGLGNPPLLDDLPAVGNYLIWAGKAREAAQAHQQYYDMALDVTYGMSVVVLADELKDQAARGAIMARLAEPVPPPGPKSPFMRWGLAESKKAMVSLAGPLNAWLDGKVPAPDFAAIDEALRPFVPATRGSMQYFLGRLLANHGLPDDANRYLGLAAKGRETNSWFRALAIRELRRKKVPLSDADISPPI